MDRSSSERLLTSALLLLECPAHSHTQARVVTRLRQIVIGTVLHCLHRRCYAAHAADHDDRCRRVDFLRLGQEHGAVHPRHPQLKQHHVNRLLAHDAQSRLLVLCLQHLQPFLLHGRRVCPSHILLVIRDENPKGAHVVPLHFPRLLPCRECHGSTPDCGERVGPGWWIPYRRAENHRASEASPETRGPFPSWRR